LESIEASLKVMIGEHLRRVAALAGGAFEVDLMEHRTIRLASLASPTMLCGFIPVDRQRIYVGETDNAGGGGVILTFSPFFDPSGMFGFWTLASPE
jgi:hypothetical protein